MGGVVAEGGGVMSWINNSLASSIFKVNRSSICTCISNDCEQMATGEQVLNEFLSAVTGAMQSLPCRKLSTSANASACADTSTTQPAQAQAQQGVLSDQNLLDLSPHWCAFLLCGVPAAVRELGREFSVEPLLTREIASSWLRQMSANHSFCLRLRTLFGFASIYAFSISLSNAMILVYLRISFCFWSYSYSMFWHQDG